MRTRFHRQLSRVLGVAVAASMLGTGPAAWASSHMDAPLITLDDAANTTDVYAFVSRRDGVEYLSTALAVYPFEEPGIGPNNYRFDDAVRYEIHVATGRDLERGRSTFTYRFEFQTSFDDPNTILQVFRPDQGAVGVEDGRFTNLNLRQTYKVTRVDRRGRERVLGTGVVPPNNQGLVTPLYNEDDGNGPARDGVASAGELDAYTRASIQELEDGYRVFAGQRDDGFYADIQAIFDGLAFRSGDDVFDSQGGFNLHTIALDIPIEELGGPMQQVGVYATTSRRAFRVVGGDDDDDDDRRRFVQVGRQGNPLFCEGLVAVADKDLYNTTSPRRDRKLFARYADSPELARLINLVLFGGAPVVQESGQADLVGIFIPDLIKVDLSTGPARLAGGGPFHPTNPDDEGFSRLGVFGVDPRFPERGPDVLPSQLTGGPVPGGWPNGRRFGDDVVDIAVTAVLNDLTDPSAALTVADGIDNVSANDIAYNKVFPYAGPPLNGRNHAHH
jgi:hypothetical protein